MMMSAAQCAMLARSAARAERTETLKETKTLAKRKVPSKVVLLSDKICCFVVRVDCFLFVFRRMLYCCLRLVVCFDCCLLSLLHCAVLGYSLAFCVSVFEELSRLLKRKGIDANYSGRIPDPVEVKKERLLARDEERK